MKLDFAMCNPSKSSRYTLSSSGSSFGLAPPKVLPRLSTPSIIDNLVDRSAVPYRVWSLTLLDTETGIFSIGGTLLKEVEEAKTRGEIVLKHFGDPMATPDWVDKQVNNHLNFMFPPGSSFEDHFKWTNVQGAAGWWTALMSGVWINGAKVRTACGRGQLGN